MTIYEVTYTSSSSKEIFITHKAFKKRKSAVGSVRKWKAKGELYGAWMKEVELIG